MFVPTYKDVQGCLVYIIATILAVVVFVSMGYVIGYKSAKTKYKTSSAVVLTNDSIKLLFEELDSLKNEKNSQELRY